MIEYISGRLVELNPATAIIDNAGIGYEMSISLSTFSAIQGKEQVKLFAHEVIREDAHLLYGFSTSRERALFREMIAVSGVGANSARLILSSIPPAELEAVIAGGDEKRLKSVKGIGAKTAQRIIVDLKDKIKPSETSLLSQPATRSDDFEEALAALLMLGFAKPASQKVLTKLFSDDPSLRVEQAVKKALTML